MFSSKSRLSFRPPGYSSHRDDNDRISPTASSMSRKMPKIRIRNAFRSSKQAVKSPRSTTLSPRDLLPLEINAVQPISPLGSSKIPQHPESHMHAPMSPVGEQKLRLMPKIAEYRCKGFLNDEQERELYTRLQQHKINPFDNSTVGEVEKKLEEYKTMFSIARSREVAKHEAGIPPQTVVEQEPKNPKQFFQQLLKNEQRQISIAKSDEENKIVDSYARDRQRSHTKGVVKRLYPDDAREELEDPLPEEDDLFKPAVSYKETSMNERAILDVKDVVDQADEDFVESLFVEMCFFARLGFLQPPICLRCLYMESVEGMEEDFDCRNFCVWRKNANEALHPTALDGNLCLVECQAARRLIDGNEVQQHYWDHIKRRLVMVER